MRTRWVLVEHKGSAAEREVVPGLGDLWLTPDEVAEIHRRIVQSPCRLYPADWFE
jgi:hypothetical protein